MAGSKVCPYCRRLNGAEESACYSCGRRLPGPAAAAGVSALQRARTTPFLVTRLLLGMCVVVFVLCTVSAGRAPPLFSSTFPGSQLIRWGVVGGNLAQLEPWRYVSAVFLHLNALHLVLNMWSLVYLARIFEEQVGGARLAFLFVVTGGLGFVVSDVWYGMFGPATAGASGALFGLMGALIGWLYSRRDPRWKDELLRFGVFALAIALMFPVNNAAHVGGFVVGVPLGFLLQRERRPDRHHRAFGVVAALLIGLCVASIVLCATSPYWQQERERELLEES